jgi:hypothetical protein
MKPIHLWIAVKKNEMEPIHLWIAVVKMMTEAIHLWIFFLETATEPSYKSIDLLEITTEPLHTCNALPISNRDKERIKDASLHQDSDVSSEKTCNATAGKTCNHTADGRLVSSLYMMHRLTPVVQIVSVYDFELISFASYNTEAYQ